MNIKPTSKKTIISIIVGLAPYIFIILRNLLGRFILNFQCNQFKRSDLIGHNIAPLGPGPCAKEYDTIKQTIDGVLIIFKEPILLCIIGILFLFTYLVYSFFQKK